jgi:hypothetical protein
MATQKGEGEKVTYVHVTYTKFGCVVVVFNKYVWIDKRLEFYHHREIRYGQHKWTVLRRLLEAIERSKGERIFSARMDGWSVSLSRPYYCLSISTKVIGVVNSDDLEITR